MNICVKAQLRNPALPLKCVSTQTGSALPLELYGMPAYMAGCAVTALTVSVTNANGVTITGNAEIGERGEWIVLFGLTNFANYGYVRYGVKIDATLTDDEGVTNSVGVAFGDFEVVQATANATPGDPTSNFIAKGSDQYWKSEVVDGVQHYKRVMIVNNPRIGWGFDLEGDYILVNGEFVAAE